MASKHPRLGVARDPEPERALARTRPLPGQAETRSAAAHVRAPALRRAESRTSVAPTDPIDPSDPTPASDALRWVRGKERASSTSEGPGRGP